jgi:hypothetical protein
MTTLSKKSAVTDTLRGVNELAFSSERGRALTNAAETWFTAATECHHEMIGFVSMRLEKDSETFREMLACKNPTDVTAIQSRWMEGTLRDYNSEMTKLMTIYTKSVNDGGRTRD